MKFLAFQSEQKKPYYFAEDKKFLATLKTFGEIADMSYFDHHLRVKYKFPEIVQISSKISTNFGEISLFFKN